MSSSIQRPPHALGIAKEQRREALGLQRLEFRRRAHRSRNLPSVAPESRANGRGRKTKPEDKQMIHKAQSHSASTLASRSLAQCLAFRAWASSSPASLFTAQTAMPRTSGEASAKSGATASSSAGSPELPAATSDVANEPVAADALNGRAPEAGAECGVIEGEQLGKRRVGRARRARANFASRAACANLFQGQTARQSSQP